MAFYSALTAIAPARGSLWSNLIPRYSGVGDQAQVPWLSCSLLTRAERTVSFVISSAVNTQHRFRFISHLRFNVET